MSPSRETFFSSKDPQVRLFNFGQNTVSSYPMQGAGTAWSLEGCIWKLPPLRLQYPHAIPLAWEQIPVQ